MTTTKLERSSGILLHPTSFPGPDGIGDLGPEAFRWIDFLESANCAVWQILPLGPTGYGDSPYQAFSAFAGNPYLVSADILLDQGILKPEDLRDRPGFPEATVDYGSAIAWKLTLLNRAYQNFKAEPALCREEFDRFCDENADWLDDYSLFRAIKDVQNGDSWINWPGKYRLRDRKTLTEFAARAADLIEEQKFYQFLFFRQWKNVKDYANGKGITIVGDIPIFVAMDSADVWSRPELFYLDDQCQPTVVAGVPPDYFSATGQLWGNPLYKWPAHQKDGYQWWIRRVRASRVLSDLIRLDHFRGFGGYWEVPAGNPTAQFGRWVKGPGEELLTAIRDSLGELPIIAEDLGEITQDVVEMRDAFGLPGMKILQFAFSGDARDLFLPHNYVQNCIAYTGTHDNDTAVGWYASAQEHEKDFCRRYLSTDGSDIAWRMVRSVWASVAVYAIAPLQDILGLDGSTRMNFPGHAAGNWLYRFRPADIKPDLAARISELNQMYNRIPSINRVPAKRPVIDYENA